MKQIFYTQEGTPYIVRTVSKNTILNLAPPSSTFQLQAKFNIPVLATDPSIIGIQNAANKIIPIECFFSMTEGNVQANEADIAAVYYSAKRGVIGTNTFEQLYALGKMLPHIDLLEFPIVSNNFYRYNLRYNQAVLAEQDFIDPAGGIIFTFSRSQYGALNFTGADANFSIPAGDYSATIVFTYFEMIK